MKSYFLLSIGLLFSFLVTQAQNLHTQANAASIENEANSTTGWAGTALITSSTTNPQNGIYSMLITTNGTGREARYTFPAVVGTVYNISIWARQGSPANNPAFANWTGFTGFTTRVISSTAWTQYNFTLTASATNPIIRVYSGPSGAASGTQVFIDAVSILASGGGGGGTTDTQAPTAPSNLIASGTTSTSTNLSWNASTDNVGVTSYTIRRNNVVVGTVGGNITTFAASGLAASTTYTFNVVASDAAGNVSGASNTVTVTTPAGGGGGTTDTQAPTSPTSLTASGTTSNSTNLSWNGSTDNVGVTSYTIRRNNIAIGSVPGNTTSFIATSLSASTTYSFNVVASDAAGNTSGASNTVTVTTMAGDGGGGGGGGTPGGSATEDFQARNLFVAGVVGIGTTPNANFLLSVDGNIRAKEVIVESGWSDFVFDPDYYLPSLSEVEEYINEKGHLKDIPSAAEVQENGVGLAEFNTRLLQKVEEMTLYLIKMDKQIQQLEAENELLKKAIENSNTEKR